MDRRITFRAILLGVTEKLDWFTELPFQLSFLYRSSPLMRFFLSNDRAFWVKIFARVGLKLRGHITNYFFYYVYGKWMIRIKCNSEYRVEFWGRACFVEREDGFFTVYPNMLKIKSNQLSICRDYLCLLKDNTLSVYFKEFDKNNIIQTMNLNEGENLSIYIKETVLGVILGFSNAPAVWRAILLDGQRISLLDDVPPNDITFYGYRASHRYYRFDNSPLRDWEEILSGLSYLIHPTDSTKAMVIKEKSGKIFCFNLETGNEEEICRNLKRDDFLIRDLTKTKFFVIK